MVNTLVEQIIDICLSSTHDRKKLKRNLFELLGQYEIRRVDSEGIHPDILEKTNLFLLSKRMEGLSERTLTKYRKLLYDFGAFVQKPVGQIAASDIRNWLAGRQDIKISTTRYYISVIRSFYDYLITEELVTVDPTRKIKLPKLEQRIPKALDIDEMEVLREGCQTLREKALLEIFYASGCRLAEIYNLNRGDINWRERSFAVTGKGKKERIVFIGARAARALKKYLDSRTDDEKALFVTEKGQPRRLSQRSIPSSGASYRLTCGSFDSGWVSNNTITITSVASGANTATVQVKNAAGTTAQTTFTFFKI